MLEWCKIPNAYTRVDVVKKYRYDITQAGRDKFSEKSEAKAIVIVTSSCVDEKLKCKACFTTPRDLDGIFPLKNPHEEG